MAVTTLLKAAGESDPGLQRDTNEDRFHSDPTRGLFVVVDGVGGQAAGETAAQTAIATLVARLGREGSGPLETRVCEAIALANNTIYRQAQARAEWRGMACVLTVAVVDQGDIVVGHVGDTRLYKLRQGRIVKLTRDHSPVGEREDAQELSELDAMRHPRRHEVYRDVGSERHAAGDPDFIDVFRVPFEADAAILLCSDGLTDSLPSTAINAIVEDHAGEPGRIARALIDAANEAGGKDNVTVVYVEGSHFAQGEDTRQFRSRPATPGVALDAAELPPDLPAPGVARPRTRWRVAALVLLLTIVAAFSAYAMRDRWVQPLMTAVRPPVPRVITVGPTGSIAQALASARPGDEVVVEPGEYRERVVLKTGVHVRGRVPRQASIRLPGGASETDAAIVAIDVVGAGLSGFRILGDAATPLGTGLLVRNADLNVTDLEVSGARHAAIEFGGGQGGSILAGHLHDNPGAALIVRSGANPRIAHSVFQRNGTAALPTGPIFIEPGSTPVFTANVFSGVPAESLVLPNGGDVSAIIKANWFEPTPAPGPTRPRPQGRR